MPSVYLDLIPIPEAIKRLRGALDPSVLGAETVPSDEAVGRVLAAPVHARASSPTAHCAAMDGIALAAEETFAAREGEPVAIPGDRYQRISTGMTLPAFADAVVMAENVVFEDGSAMLEAPAFPWQHVRRIGEDIVATELLLPRGRRLSAYDLGALLSAGVYEVQVVARPSLALIPTGDEILDYTKRPAPGPGQVVESNSVMLREMARGFGIAAERIPPVKDEPDSLERAVREALERGFSGVALVAGSSAGDRDHAREVMERVGEVLVHGVQAMPGKPALLAKSGDGRLLACIPGYPVSAAVAFEQLVGPLLCHLGRLPVPERALAEVELTRAVPSRPGMEEFVRVSVGEVPRPEGPSLQATPLARGAGLLTTLTRAQAVVRLPRDSEGAEAGSRHTAELLVPRHELYRTLVAVGSHDNTLDLLADLLMGLDDPVRLASTHAGSMGGITALRQGKALCGGAHLFDPETGDFNFPFLTRYAPDEDIAAVNLAVRHQGLMVAPGNPKGIKGVEDLARVAFVNRQRGAGTRILLDHHLNTAGIDPRQVEGYEHEEFTHMAVAANVAQGAADCGLGIKAAAQALGLDFVPLARERYDLLIRPEHMEHPLVAELLDVVRGGEFAKRVEELGGYETPWTGKEMRPGDGLPG